MEETNNKEIILLKVKVASCVMSGSLQPHWSMVAMPTATTHGILQARILDWVVILFSRGSSRPRDWTWVSPIAGRFFTVWAISHYEVALVLWRCAQAGWGGRVSSVSIKGGASGRVFLSARGLNQDLRKWACVDQVRGRKAQPRQREQNWKSLHDEEEPALWRGWSGLQAM